MVHRIENYVLVVFDLTSVLICLVFHFFIQNNPLEQLLHYLLNPDPQRRCDATEALNLPYFKVPEESATSLPLTVSTLSEATESRYRNWLIMLMIGF